jgi:hypothetical protein
MSASSGNWYFYQESGLKAPRERLKKDVLADLSARIRSIIGI